MRDFNAETSSEKVLSRETSYQDPIKKIKASSLRLDSEDLHFNSLEILTLDSKSNFVTIQKSINKAETSLKPSLGLVTLSPRSVKISKRLASSSLKYSFSIY